MAGCVIVIVVLADGNVLFVELKCSLQTIPQGGTFLDPTHRSVRFDPPAQHDCRALAETLTRIGDKWTVLVVGVLTNGPTRYSQIRRLIDGISQRMLTLTLKGLEQDGLVSRTMYPTSPPRVDYALTDLGQTLTAPLQVLYSWAAEHRPAIEAARQRFAEKSRDLA
jgi:DNA-binding HxlR family transcriptional regulator